MADTGKGITGRVRRAVSEVASAAARGGSSVAARAVAAAADAGAKAGRTSAAPAKAAPAAKTVKKAVPAKKAAPAKKVAGTKAAPAKAPAKAAPAKAPPKTPAAKAVSAARKAPPRTSAAAADRPDQGSGADNSLTPARKAPATRKPPAPRKAPAPRKVPSARTAPAAATSAATPTPTPTPTATPGAAPPETLVVRADEDPWTPEELGAVRDILVVEAARLRAEIAEVEADIADLTRDVGETGGEDQADAGNKTFERDHEMALAASHREILAQTEHALQRIADGSYGVCESCGRAIGKARLQAFPRATLCMTCKQREERR